MSQGDPSVEEQIEKLDQEITLRLQTIDSNLGYCFKKITQDIIPHVRKYSTICDNIIDSTACLTTIFQESGNLNLNSETAKQNVNEQEEGETKNDMPDSLLPRTTNIELNEGNIDLSQDFHTANITSTGQVLKLPDSSDEEDEVNHERFTTKRKNADDTNQTEEGNDSTMQRQSRRRKISLLLQQQYGSSSSAIPSPVTIYKNKKKIVNEEKDSEDEFDSSPIRGETRVNEANEANESTKDLLNIDSSS